MMMSDGSLSQAEIDALLNSNNEGAVAVAGPAAPVPPAHSPSPPPFTSNSPLGSATPPSTPTTDIATIKKTIEQTVPVVTELITGLINTKSALKLVKSEALDSTTLQDMFDAPLVQIKHTVVDPSAGGELLHLLSGEKAVSLASVIIGQDDLTINDLVLNALQEVFSQISEPLLQQIGEQRGEAVEVGAGEAVQIPPDALAIPMATPVLNTYHLSFEKDEITFYQIFDQTLFNAADAIQPSADPSPIAAPLSESQHQPSFIASGVAAPMPAIAASAGGEGAAWAAVGTAPPPPPQVHPVMLNDFSSEVNASHHGSLELLMDVDMRLTVELGQTRKQVREILQLGEGSIIELDKLAGEPVDVKVNQQLIAKGEVVVIDENFGVRITEIISPVDRMRHVG